MATQAPKQSIKAKPYSWYGLIAEDIRQERSGKLTVVGLYADSQILVAMREDQADPTLEKPLFIDAVTVLFHVRLPEPDTCKLELIMPSGKVLSAGTAPFVSPTQSMVSRFSPMKVPQFGNWKIRVKGSYVDFEFKFEILRGPSNSEFVKSLHATAAPAVAVKRAAKKTVKRASVKK